MHRHSHTHTHTHTHTFGYPCLHRPDLQLLGLTILLDLRKAPPLPPALLPALSQLQVINYLRQACPLRASLFPSGSHSRSFNCPKCRDILLCPQDSGEPPLIQRLVILIHEDPPAELCGFQVGCLPRSSPLVMERGGKADLPDWSESPGACAENSRFCMSTGS
jgi:hypothetical protein